MTIKNSIRSVVKKINLKRAEKNLKKSKSSAEISTNLKSLESFSFSETRHSPSHSLKGSEINMTIKQISDEKSEEFIPKSLANYESQSKQVPILASFENCQLPERVSCECEEHPGRELINRTFNLSVKRLKQLIFTDSEVVRKFWKYRKLSNVQVTDWIDGCQQLDYSMNLGPLGTGKNVDNRVVDSLFIFIQISKSSLIQNVFFCC